MTKDPCKAYGTDSYANAIVAQHSLWTKRTGKILRVDSDNGLLSGTTGYTFKNKAGGIHVNLFGTN